MLSRFKNKYTLHRLVSYIFYKYRIFFGIHDVFNRRRIYLSKIIFNYFDGVIQAGPFNGLRLVEQSSWGIGDRASMIFGLYESEVLNSLIKKPGEYKTFVDVGAADGYYAVGGLKAKLFERVYCFEVNPRSREIILKNASINGVSGSISVFGKANNDFIKLLPFDILSSAVFLIDIEGGEFDLLTTEVLDQLKQSIVYIELHDGLLPNGQNLKNELIMRCIKTHNLLEFTSGSRDLSGIDFLQNFNDNDRWLMCSEGRPYRMSWLQLTPK